ncbi:hypothetical protein XENOCAPTIV_017596 [Xenoophorus captivus]|uniref:Uncharacterized protein n=1 Tax=Xenoophorus captivus TaxID=1517983 RepID=A0ABV0R995_9TELE
MEKTQNRLEELYIPLRSLRMKWRWLGRRRSKLTSRICHLNQRLDEDGVMVKTGLKLSIEIKRSLSSSTRTACFPLNYALFRERHADFLLLPSAFSPEYFSLVQETCSFHLHY